MEVQAFEGKKNKFLYVSIVVGIIYYLLPMIINYGVNGSKYTLHNISELYLNGGNSFFAVMAVLLMVYFYSGQIKMDLLQYEISYGISLKKIILSKVFYAPVLCSVTLSLVSAGIMILFAVMSRESIPTYYWSQLIMMLVSLLTVSQMTVFFIVIAGDVGKGANGALAIYYFLEIGIGLILSGLEYVFGISLRLIRSMLLWIEVSYTFGTIDGTIHLLQMVIMSFISWGVHFGIFYLILKQKLASR